MSGRTGKHSPPGLLLLAAFRLTQLTLALVTLTFYHNSMEP